MPRAVRIHDDFRRDFSRQVEWLRRHATRSWLDGLDSDLDRVVVLLSRYPAAGTAVERRGTIVMRYVVFPRTPFLAWYAFDEGARGGDVWLLRLLHARQRRAAPRLERWVPMVEER